jgi:hypothetical protein
LIAWGDCSSGLSPGQLGWPMCLVGPKAKALGLDSIKPEAGGQIDSIEDGVAQSRAPRQGPAAASTWSSCKKSVALLCTSSQWTASIKERGSAVARGRPNAENCFSRCRLCLL